MRNFVREDTALKCFKKNILPKRRAINNRIAICETTVSSIITFSRNKKHAVVHQSNHTTDRKDTDVA